MNISLALLVLSSRGAALLAVNPIKQVWLVKHNTVSPVQPIFSALFVFLVRLLSEVPPPSNRLCFSVVQTHTSVPRWSYVWTHMSANTPPEARTCPARTGEVHLPVRTHQPSSGDRAAPELLVNAIKMPHWVKIYVFLWGEQHSLTFRTGSPSLCCCHRFISFICFILSLRLWWIWNICSSLGPNLSVLLTLSSQQHHHKIRRLYISKYTVF